MRVHHLNCISECPLGGALMDGVSGRRLRARLACHCLAVETPEGLVLVDTGFGLGDVRAPTQRLSRFFLTLNAPDFEEELTAVRQLERLGFRAGDVRHILMTHLDFDHAGGIEDFPEAQVHLLTRERDAALARRTLLDRARYRPQQWAHTQSRWHVWSPGEGAHWFGFDAIQPIGGLDGLLLVPLIGHTLGHCGVAVEADGGWLFDAGDAYFWHSETHPTRPRCTAGLRAYQTLMEKNRRARLWNQRRLRELRGRHGREVRIFCSHDPNEFRALASRPLDMPASGLSRGVRPAGRPARGSAVEPTPGGP